MGLAGAVRACLGKYLTFSGRALRSEFWYFVLGGCLISLAAAALDLLLFGTTQTATLATDTAQASASTTSGPSVIGTVVSLGLVAPTLAVTWRRLHDIGRAGWWCLLPHAVGFCGIMLAMIVAGGLTTVESLDATSIFQAMAAGSAGLLIFGIMFAPLIAYIVLVVWLASRGEPGANRFGPPPSGA